MRVLGHLRVLYKQLAMRAHCVSTQCTTWLNFTWSSFVWHFASFFPHKLSVFKKAIFLILNYFPEVLFLSPNFFPTPVLKLGQIQCIPQINRIISSRAFKLFIFCIWLKLSPGAKHILKGPCKRTFLVVYSLSHS